MAERAPGFDGITLRACSLHDTAALALVGAATFLEAFAGLLDGMAITEHCRLHHSVDTYQAYLQSPGCRAWLAVIEPGSAPIGYLLLTPPDLPLPDIAPSDIELKRIYVFSRFYGRGIGQRLMNQAIAAAKEMGSRRLLLGVHRESARAIAFYQRNGFSQVGTRTFQLGHLLYDDLVFGRSL